MEKGRIRLMFDMICCACFGTRLSSGQRELCTDETIKDILAFARRHDLAHFIKVALDREGFIQGEEDYDVLSEFATAVYRDEARQMSYDELCELLSSKKIPFMPLKGAVTGRLYPEKWMRTSSDIDILLHKEDIEKAVGFLTKDCGYKLFLEGQHDVSLYSPYDTHIELHHTLQGSQEREDRGGVLQQAWELSSISKDNPYLHEMSDGLLYFYHICHMARHFEHGGCGIKPFLDLYLLDRLEEADKSQRELLLSKGGLLKFAAAAKALCLIWFEAAQHDEITYLMEYYVLSGGVYGNASNRLLIQQPKKGGSAKYFLSRLFIPFDNLKVRYPIITKHRWLAPFYQVVRWTKLFSPQTRKKAGIELEKSKGMSEEKSAQILAFLESLGL